MVRLSPRGIAGGASQSPDSSAELSRLVQRLQQSVLYADHDREKRLRSSEYERSRVGVNLDYARTVLKRLEQDAVGIKVHSRRQEVQADLNRKREVLDDVAERLRDLAEMHGDDDSSDGEDVLGEIALDTPSESVESRTKDSESGDNRSERSAARDAPASAAAPISQPAQATKDLKAASTEQDITTATRASEPNAGPPSATTTAKALAPSISEPTFETSQSLRTRATATQPHPPSSNVATGPYATTSATPQNPRDLLFGGGRSSPLPPALSAVAASEAVLDRQRAEQEELASSLLSMAAALKQSSRAFGASLEAEQDILRDAGKGLDKTAIGMEAAHRRMSTLRRMAEGQGWWGRVMLYVWIVGLMIAMLVVVFATPKLRF